MPDQFDVQRKLDHPDDGLAEDAMERLEDDKAKARERNKRLIQLDKNHYFDPEDREIFMKDGEQLKHLEHSPDYIKKAAEKVEAEARDQGFTPVPGGFFWNATTKHLYVKNGEHYVLYST